jgi:hypothetical protein
MTGAPLKTAALAVAVAATLSGCASQSFLTDEQALSLAMRTHSFQEMVRLNAVHPAAMVDFDDGKYVFVAIGENMEDHFTRWGTLRVDRESGAVAKEGYDEEGEFQYRAEPVSERD